MTKNVFNDLSGLRFGRLIALKHLGNGKWECKCDCGNTAITRGSALTSGTTKSCGCLKRDVDSARFKKHGALTHDGKAPRLYLIWKSINSRCSNKKDVSYNLYGGQGINVCDEWLDYTNFYNWAMSNGYNNHSDSNKLFINRKDIHSDYSPCNCYWSTHTQYTKKHRTSLPVELIDKQENVIAIFDSAKNASDATNIPVQNILRVCQGHIRTTYNTQWRYSDISDVSRLCFDEESRKASEYIRSTAVVESVDGEEWRPVPEFEEYYEVSSLGRVRSIENKQRIKTRATRPKVLSQTDNGNGYLFVQFHINGSRKNRYVHRLVAEAFVENPEKFPVVDHINHDRKDNRASNLRWCSQQDNVKHSSSLMSKPRLKPMTNTSERYVSKQKNGKFRVTVFGKQICVCETLSEAVERRDKAIEEAKSLSD